MPVKFGTEPTESGRIDTTVLMLPLSVDALVFLCWYTQDLRKGYFDVNLY
jgi:hypothetical protein